MHVFKIKHDFPKPFAIFSLIVLYCSPIINGQGQDDFDYRESYLLRTRGDVPTSGSFVIFNDKNIMKRKYQNKNIHHK